VKDLKELVKFMVDNKLLELEQNGTRLKLHESALFPAPKAKKGEKETGLPDDSLEHDELDESPHERLRRERPWENEKGDSL
jgi:hypothetical protein